MKLKQVYAWYDQEKTPPADGFAYCPYCKTELVLTESGNKQRPTCPACGFVQYRNPAPTISIVIVDGDRVLLGRRIGNPGAGKWSFPSGYVEYEDDFLTTTVREAQEETGLDVEPRSILHVLSSAYSPTFHFLAIYVLARVAGGELEAGDDLDAVAWFPLSGPLPEMAFQEDVDLIGWYAAGRMEGLPVETRA